MQTQSCRGTPYRGSYAAGGVQAVIKELSKRNLIDLDLMTVTGHKIRTNIENVQILDYDVIRPIEDPYSETGAEQSERKSGAQRSSG